MLQTVIRWTTALALLVSIVWQVADRVIHNLFRPGEYFAYFSIQSTMIAIVTLSVAGWFSLKGLEETRLLSLVRLSMGCFMAVTGIVYNALLRGLPPAAADAGYVWPVPPNEIIHVWGPILIALDLIVFAPRLHLKLREGLWVWVYPLAWLAFSVIRGLATDWWPYWFINPNEDAGVPGVVEYVLAIMAFLWVLAFLFQMFISLSNRMTAARLGS